MPTTGYTGPASFTYSITDALGGVGTGTVSLTVNYPVTAQSLFNTGDTPATVTVNDPNSVELGVKFQASTTGTITGIRFYKGPQNTGTHVADLWSATGTLLATATFTNETASGWQQVNLSTPVVVTAGTTYVVSYHTNGDYSARSQLLRHRAYQWGADGTRQRDERRRRRVCLRHRSNLSDQYLSSQQLLGRRRLRRNCHSTAGRQQRQRVRCDREHRTHDSGLGASRQRHGPERLTAVDHGGEQSEQRHGHLQLEHADRQLRADHRLLRHGKFHLLNQRRQGGTASANVSLTVNDPSTVEFVQPDQHASHCDGE